MTREEFVRMDMRALLRKEAISLYVEASNMTALANSLGRGGYLERNERVTTVADSMFETADIIFKIADEISEALSCA